MAESFAAERPVKPVGRSRRRPRGPLSSVNGSHLPGSPRRNASPPSRALHGTRRGFGSAGKAVTVKFGPIRVELLWCREEGWGGGHYVPAVDSDRPVTIVTVAPDQIWMGFGGVRSPLVSWMPHLTSRGGEDVTAAKRRCCAAVQAFPLALPVSERKDRLDNFPISVSSDSSALLKCPILEEGGGGPGPRGSFCWNAVQMRHDPAPCALRLTCPIRAGNWCDSHANGPHFLKECWRICYKWMRGGGHACLSFSRLRPRFVSWKRPQSLQ